MSIWAILIRRRVEGPATPHTESFPEERGTHEKAYRVRVHDSGRRSAGTGRKRRRSGWRLRVRWLDMAVLARRHRTELRRDDEGCRRVSARASHVRDARGGIRADACRRSVWRSHERTKEVRRVADVEGADVAQHYDHSRQCD